MLALIGLVVGAVVAGEGTEGILDTFAIDGTVFGVTIATLALSLEDIFLTAEPAAPRRAGDRRSRTSSAVSCSR